MDTFVMRTSPRFHYVRGFTNTKPSSLTLTCSHSTNHPPNSNPSRALARKLLWSWKQDGRFNSKGKDCASLMQALSRKRMPQVAWELLCEMKSEGFLSDPSILSSVMISCADNRFFTQAQAIWDEILYSSFSPSVDVISKLMDAYGKTRRFDEITKILDQLSSRNYELLNEVYSMAISCFGKHGQLELMEKTLKKMVLGGFSIDSATGNAFVTYYSIFGSLTEMETAYATLKRSRLLLEEEAIRAVAFAYIKERKFYKLGEFLRDVGLGRRNVGNHLWNLLLLSYAGNFKMKSLQREFLGMLNAGFRPDLTTFNIRALAFSRMSLFWDLHLSLEHMEHENVVPDLVTYGCVVDAYLDKRLGRNLDFALHRMNLDDSPLVATDPLVFEVLGKGDFHSSSEAFLEFKTKRKWTYRDLIAVHLKKRFRRNQVFWNY